MKVYIAGPMQGAPLFNFPAFDLMASRLNMKGYEPLNPAEADREAGFDPHALEVDNNGKPILPDDWDWDAVIRRDVLMLMEADAIVLLPGWHRSTGAKAEAALAQFRHIPRLSSVTLEEQEWWKDVMTQEEMAIRAGPDLEQISRRRGTYIMLHDDSVTAVSLRNTKWEWHPSGAWCQTEIVSPVPQVVEKTPVNAGKTFDILTHLEAVWSIEHRQTHMNASLTKSMRRNNLAVISGKLQGVYEVHRLMMSTDPEDEVPPIGGTVMKSYEETGAGA